MDNQNLLKQIPIGVHSIVREDLLAIASAKLPWESLTDKKIMITGGGGFLASYIIQSILLASKIYHLNCEVICVARSISSVESRLSAWLPEANLSIFIHDVSEVLPANFPTPDFIIHAASQASPKHYGVDPVGTLKANSIGTMQLLEFAKLHDTEKFLFFSSGEVYGLPTISEANISEDDYGYLDPMKVRSCYAESKRIGETMCVAYSHQFGIHTSIVRPFHTYGPGMALDDGRVFADFVSDVVFRRNIALKSDGYAVRPFCYIADATIGILIVLLKGEVSNAYNIGNPSAEISIRELAKTVAGLFPERAIKTQFMMPVDKNLYLKSPVPRACPSIDKIKKLGWKPSVSIEDGFRRTIKFYIE